MWLNLVQPDPRGSVSFDKVYSILVDCGEKVDSDGGGIGGKVSGVSQS